MYFLLLTIIQELVPLKIEIDEEVLKLIVLLVLAHLILKKILLK